MRQAEPARFGFPLAAGQFQVYTPRMSAKSPSPKANSGRRRPTASYKFDSWVLDTIAAIQEHHRYPSAAETIRRLVLAEAQKIGLGRVRERETARKA